MKRVVLMTGGYHILSSFIVVKAEDFVFKALLISLWLNCDLNVP